MTTTTFYLADAKHHRSLAAGDTYDGNVYHQLCGARPNATWTLTPVGGGGYHVVDQKHGKCVVAGDDGNIYHQDPQGLAAIWDKQAQPLADPNGVESFYLVDRKHGLALVTGDVYDVHVYNQAPQNRPNAIWTLYPAVQSAICLRVYSGQYVHVDPSDNQTIVAKRSAVGGWDPLQLITLECGYVALRASNGNYVSAVNGGGAGLVANQATGIGPWESFLFSDIGSACIALQANNGQYVSSDKDAGGVPLVANRQVRIGLESFGIVRQPAAFAWETLAPNLGNVAANSDGSVAASGSNAFQWNGSGAPGILPNLAQVAIVAPNQIWVVDSSGHISRWNGSSWTAMPSGPTQISAGADGTVWGVNGGGVIFQWNQSVWNLIGGNLAQITVASGSLIYGANPQGVLYTYNNGWQLIPGNMKSLAVAGDGTLFGVSAQGGVCIYRGGSTWEHLPVNLKQLAVSSGGLLWGMDQNGAIVRGVAFANPTVDATTRVAVQEEQSTTNPLVYKFSTESADAATAAGFKQLREAFVAHSKPQPGTVPIYKETQVANPGSAFHFYHRTDTEARGFGFMQTEVAFHAFLWPAPGTVPVYREYVGTTSYYHFSTNTQSGFKQADIAFYAYPASVLSTN